MLSKFKNVLKSKNLIEKDDGVLIAVSGGIDSMVLLQLFRGVAKNLSLNLVVAHVNYQKRGEDSELEQKLVEKTCNELNIPCEVKRFNVKCDGENFQNEARKFRYEFFRDVCIKHALNKIATAHNLDDHVETILLHIIRGAGLNGVKGIAEASAVSDEFTIVRPLLMFSRDEIEKFAKDNNVTYREDKSNASLEYNRNKVRHALIPLLKEFNPNFLIHMDSLSKEVQAASEFVEILSKKVYRQQRKSSKNSVSLDKEFFLEQPQIMRCEILRLMFQDIHGSTVDLNRDQIVHMVEIAEKGCGDYKLPHDINYVCDKVQLKMIASA